MVSDGLRASPHRIPLLTADIRIDMTDGSLAPVLIRLAWHASGTYNKADNTGGSNYATMRFKPEASHGANNGLVRRLVCPPWFSTRELTLFSPSPPPLS